MANINAPFGFRLCQEQAGDVGVGKARLVFVPSTDGTAIYVGDAVKTATGLDSATGCGLVTASTANTDVVRGFVLSCITPVTAQNLAIGTLYRPASTAQYLLICDDPGAEFEIQCSGSITASVAHMGTNIDYGTAGSTSTGLSGMQASATVGTTSKQLRILEAVNVPNNALGSNVVIRVRINDTYHEFTQATAV